MWLCDCVIAWLCDCVLCCVVFVHLELRERKPCIVLLAVLDISQSALNPMIRMDRVKYIAGNVCDGQVFAELEDEMDIISLPDWCSWERTVYEERVSCSQEGWSFDYWNICTSWWSITMNKPVFTRFVERPIGPLCACAQISPTYCLRPHFVFIRDVHHQEKQKRTTQEHILHDEKWDWTQI